MSGFADSLGAAGAAKYGYQAARSYQGLGTTTALTAGLDLASGTVGTTAAADAAETVKSLSTTTKGIAGAARLTPFARVAGFAGRVAPAIAKGSAALGVALGGYEIAQGVGDVRAGKTSEGREKIITGAADVVTSTALGVAAVASGSVVGVPIAAVALGVAGVSQGAKYAYKYADKIGDAAEWAGGKIGQAASNVGDSVRRGWGSLKSALFPGPIVEPPKLSYSNVA